MNNNAFSDKGIGLLFPRILFPSINIINKVYYHTSYMWSNADLSIAV
jgi:hypothetical protein